MDKSRKIIVRTDKDAWKKEHAKYLNQPFEMQPLKHQEFKFPENEKKLLHRYGTWLTALMVGELRPKPLSKLIL